MARVLLLCQDIVGANMAGPGIRYWELANALSRDHEVTLAAPNEPDIAGDRFAIVSYAERRVATFMADYDVMVGQVFSAAMLHAARRDGVRLIFDAYDPALLEVLEIAREEPLDRQRAANRRHRVETSAALLFADAVVCASEKQRDLWLGALMALGQITPDAYREDVSLRSRVAVVPFGTQEEDARRTGPGFRARLGIKDTDKVLLWGGGIWNWFDPLTLIRAVELLGRRRDDVKLVFLGLKHPNAAVPEMEMSSRAIALAEKLGLLDRSVFFNYGWVPYEERQNHLLDADVGLSTHFDHIETRFSFRTRLLDYFWSGLPIVATKGDAMADLILQRDLGRTVDFEDPAGLAVAIAEVLDDEAARRAIVANLREVRDEYRWSRVAEPLSALISRLGTTGPRGLSWAERRSLAELYGERLRTEQAHKGVRGVAASVLARGYGVLTRR
jgi:glycosyltransferase involved in cell wall biosynthesis